MFWFEFILSSCLFTPRPRFSCRCWRMRIDARLRGPRLYESRKYAARSPPSQSWRRCGLRERGGWPIGARALGSRKRPAPPLPSTLRFFFLDWNTHHVTRQRAEGEATSTCVVSANLWRPEQVNSRGVFVFSRFNQHPPWIVRPHTLSSREEHRVKRRVFSFPAK